MPALAEFGVELIEQPLPAGDDDALASVPHPIPICADEACHTTGDLDRLAGKYDAVNIKLDKTGGLTEALALADAAQAARLHDHGRLHDRHLAGDGAGDADRAAGRDRRSRRAAAARRRPRARAALRRQHGLSAGTGSVGLTR